MIGTILVFELLCVAAAQNPPPTPSECARRTEPSTCVLDGNQDMTVCLWCARERLCLEVPCDTNFSSYEDLCDKVDYHDDCAQQRHNARVGLWILIFLYMMLACFIGAAMSSWLDGDSLGSLILIWFLRVSCATGFLGVVFACSLQNDLVLGAVMASVPLFACAFACLVLLLLSCAGGNPKLACWSFFEFAAILAATIWSLRENPLQGYDDTSSQLWIVPLTGGIGLFTTFGLILARTARKKALQYEELDDPIPFRASCRSSACSLLWHGALVSAAAFPSNLARGFGSSAYVLLSLCFLLRFVHTDAVQQNLFRGLCVVLVWHFIATAFWFVVEYFFVVALRGPASFLSFGVALLFCCGFTFHILRTRRADYRRLHHEIFRQHHKTLLTAHVGPDSHHIIAQYVA